MADSNSTIKMQKRRAMGNNLSGMKKGGSVKSGGKPMPSKGGKGKKC